MDKNAGLEAKAAQLFQRGQYKEALQTYTSCVENLTKHAKHELKISLTFNRSACYLKLKQFQKVVDDCNLILVIDPKNDKALGRKIKALCSLGNFSAAQSLANQWIQSDPLNAQARKEWERLEVIVKALKGQDDEDGLISGPVEKFSPQHKIPPQSRPLFPNPGQQNNLYNTGSVWNIAPTTPTNPWQTDDKKQNATFDMAWGRANNTTWEGLPDEKASLDFPALNKEPRSNTSLVSSTNYGSNVRPGSNTNHSLTSSNVEAFQPQTVASNMSTTFGYHGVGKAPFPPPLPMGSVVQSQNEKTGKQEQAWGSSTQVKSDIPWPEKSRQDPPWPDIIKQEPPWSNIHKRELVWPDKSTQSSVNLWGASITPKDFQINTEHQSEPQSVLEFAQKQNISQAQSQWGSLSRQNSDRTASGAILSFAGVASQAGLNQTRSNGKDVGLEAALDLPVSGLDSVANNQNMTPSGQSRFSLYKSLGCENKSSGNQNNEQTATANAFNLAKSGQSSSSNASFQTNNASNDVARIGQSFIPHVIQTKMLASKHGTPAVSNGKNTLGMDGARGRFAQNTSAAIMNVGQPVQTHSEPDKGATVITEMSNPSKMVAIDEHAELAKEEQPVKDETTKQENENVVERKGPIVWKYRQPPRGLTSQEYTKCHRFLKFGHCQFGENCTQAHSDAEVLEWKERFEQKRQSIQKARDVDKEVATYAENLMEKLLRTEDTSSVMVENLEGVNVHMNTDLKVNMSSKKCSQTWVVTVTSKMNIQHICLLDDTNRKQFYIAAITMGPKKSQKTQKVKDHCQEWLYHEYKPGKGAADKIFRIKIQFKTEIYGTFRQTVILDFGTKPVIQRELCVDSSPVTDIDKLAKDLTMSECGRWDTSKIDLIEFKPKRFPIMEEERLLLENYPAPSASAIQQASASQSLVDPTLTRDNYKQRMHSLLYVEEMAQFSSISKYNINIHLQLVKSFLLTPAATSTAKYAQNGELFARMVLVSDISEDTSHGRLILQNVHTVLLAPASSGKNGKEPEKVYEALIEEKGKNFIFLRLSSECTKDLGLKVDKEFHAQIQFQLNRLPLVEMHLALDLLRDLNVVFPSLEPGAVYPSIPWTPGRQWQDKIDTRLNAKQKEAVLAITTKQDVALPPVLIVGPYGTGKTFTLAHTAKQILKQDGTRVLICAHSNSAADIYIREYLHPYVIEGHSEALPLRVYYRQRWVQTVNPVVLQYCLTKVERVKGTVFVNPTKEAVEKHRVVVCTLSTTRQLYNIGLKPGHFSHILIDEAAQALESETIMPLVLADADTRVVLAGDHMQLSPEVHSDFGKDRNLDVSFLARMCDIYPHDFPCKILLCENYRSHKAIIDFTSELFYDNKLLASGNQPKHDKYWPLSFFTAQGQDTQHQNSTGFYNNAEVYEVVDRVCELTKSWPESWGNVDGSAIGVVAPYADQVIRIRSELRKKKLFSVSVERVLNVQGKQFRAIFLSTVRTRHTCSSDSAMEDIMEYGFLSNVKLLNTAITRAQSLVAVIGDPVSLCSIGKCRKLWERFIELCNDSGSLHGMTWSHLRAQLDGVELKKTYILNPLAPEFIPNRLRHAAYVPPEPIAYGKFGYAFAPQNHIAQATQWQQAHRQAPVLTQLPYYATSSQMYYSMMHPSMGVMPGGFGIHPNYPRYINPAARAQLPPTFSGPKSIARPPRPHGPRPDAEKPPEESGDARVDVERMEKEGFPIAKDPRVFAMVPPPQINRVVPQAMPYQPRLMYHPALGPMQSLAGLKLPAYPPHLLQSQPMLGINQQRFAVAQQQGLSVNAHHALLAQQGRVSPSHLQLRDPRAAMHSPNRTSPRSTAPASSHSPARAAPPTSKVEFLPKAVNVKTAPVSKPAPAVSQAGQPLFAPHAPPPQIPHAQIPQSYVPTNPFLQRELYSYIMQTEGQRAADTFVQQSLQRDQTLYQQMQYVQRQQLLQQQQQQQQLSQHQGPPLYMSNSPLGMPPKQPALNASDLEKQWQEESLKGAASSQQGHSQPLFINPNLHTLTQDPTATRRQSPFGDGPQPYSRLNEEQKQEIKQSASSASDVTDPLNIDVVLEPSSAEKELGNLHVDSPVNLSPGASRSKAPLYMRRVGQGEASNAPRLSYASALRTPTTNIEDIPERTPQTVGPFTPEGNFFLNRYQPHSADSTASSIGQDPLEILKNLKLQESPKDNSQDHPFSFQ